MLVASRNGSAYRKVPRCVTVWACRAFKGTATLGAPCLGGRCFRHMPSAGLSAGSCTFECAPLRLSIRRLVEISAKRHLRHHRLDRQATGADRRTGQRIECAPGRSVLTGRALEQRLGKERCETIPVEPKRGD